MLKLASLALNYTALVDRAQHRTGLSDFGEFPYEEGLRVFLRACIDEANLSAFGSLGTRWDMLRLLSNLLRLRHEEAKTPSIARAPVLQPIFITGLPRSGTTFLHQLLAEDSNNRAPRVWELIYPYPPLASLGHADHRERRVSRQLRMFAVLAPRLAGIHPMSATSPQECSEITAHILTSLRFDTTHVVPSYRRWVDARGHIGAYEFHKRFLQHLQHQASNARRWVLKCPDHVFALDAIRAVYPDARIVFVHRDPVRVLRSVTQLTEVLRKPFTRHINRSALAAEEFDRWSAGADLMIKAADDEAFAEPIYHVQYHDLIADPLGSVAALYQHFGLALDREAPARMQRLVASNRTGNLQNGAYWDALFSLDTQEVHRRFAAYMTRFEVPRESQPARHPISTVQAALVSGGRINPAAS
jgi:hypothetical protein